jgi:3'-phosphoadenosine 5'-phosphosulfate (PAPS) 3'-phosphatase
MNNKDKLTNATMQELQANLDEEIDIDEDNNSQLKKIVESYVKDDNLEEFGRVFVATTTFPGTKHKNCDIAAVKVIIEEAGGIVTDLFGNEQRYDASINGAVISNGRVHSEVIETVKRYLNDRKKEN